MKISLNPAELAKCRRFLTIRESNMRAGELYDYLLDERFADIHPETIDQTDERRSYRKAFLKVLGRKEDDPEVKRLARDNRFGDFKALLARNYVDDPFVRTVRNLRPARRGRWSLERISFEPYEPFVYDEIDVDPDTYAEISRLGYFRRRFRCLAALEGGAPWMSLIPHELNTMRPLIAAARGSVLVLGLGLGYLPYMCAIKDEVSTVTVIERDPDIIALFRKSVLPLLGIGGKLRIVEGEAVRYLRENDVSSYDVVLADLWRDVEDGLGIYLRIKNLERKAPRTKFRYWIETSLLAMLRRELLTVFEEQLGGSAEKDYLKARDENDRIINRLYFLTKESEIRNARDLRSLLSDPSLRRLAVRILDKD